MDTFTNFEETEQSKIFPNEAFGYSKVVVERPLRLKVELTDDSRSRFRAAGVAVGEEQLADLIDLIAEDLGSSVQNNFNVFKKKVEDRAKASGVKLTAKRIKLIQTDLAIKDEAAEPVIAKIHRSGQVQEDALHGRFGVLIDGKEVVVEYVAASELRDSEQVPLLEEGGIEAFFRREVLPHVPDAWIQESSTKIGYEISFTRYFYKPQPLRTLQEIRADIEALERETEGLLSEILG